MKVIITGASGMVGRGVLLECLADDSIEKVLMINRSTLDIKHAKLEELLHDDFSDYSGIQDQLKPYNACFLCMGISSASVDQERFHEVTYTYTITLAEAILAVNKEVCCTYVSGKGTDRSESGSVMWARVKGKTENKLLTMGFEKAFMFRPNAIIPLKGIKSKTKAYQFIYDYFMWAVKLMKRIKPESVVNTTQVGRAMINVCHKGFGKEVLESREILEAAK